MYNTLYWLAVLIVTVIAAVLLTIVWLDTPTRDQRDAFCPECDEVSRSNHPSGRA